MRMLLCITLFLLIVTPSRGTWSIVCYDTTTGEIAIGSATCLAQFDLKEGASIVLVGKGAAAAQSRVDSSGANRQIIWDEMMLGTDPARILALLDEADNLHQQRQYGFVDSAGRTLTFTGSGASAWAGGLTGVDGSVVYCIQGNLLVDEPVITAAEAALLSTPGDVPARLMAAMEAAMVEGGDARCSQFGKSAHIGYMIVSRDGDTEGVCNANDGCANGDYFMEFNVAFQLVANPDAVIQLRNQFDTWREDLRGAPDAIQSVAGMSQPVITPDGTSTSTLSFELRDWDGGPVDPSTVAVTVEHASDSDGVTTIGPVNDLGGGNYSVELTASLQQGLDRFRITADDGLRPVILMPSPTLTSRRLIFEYPDGMPPFVDRDGGTVITVRVLADRSNQPMPGTGMLHVSDGAGFIAAPMVQVADNLYEATFPATTCGADVNYFVSARTTSGETSTDPLTGEAGAYFARNATGSVRGFHDNFETDTGWTTTDFGASSGFWERGVPVDDPFWMHDPRTDGDGSGQCYLTQNEEGNTDVDHGSVQLISPVLDLSRGFLSLEYDFYLRLFPTTVPDNMLVEMSSNGDAGPWIEVALYDRSFGLNWSHEVLSAEFLASRGVAFTDNVKIRFTATDGDPQSNVEAAIDGLIINVSDCVRCKADMDADGVLNTRDLLDYLNRLVALDPTTDLAPPYGVYNGADLTTYLGWYGAGCP